jgi:osmotically-inducible protein OsmY
MSYERRFDQPGPRPDRDRGARYQGGPERDRYRTGREQRYWPERQHAGHAGGYEGDRRYPQGGYREETGVRDFYEAGEFDDSEWSNRAEDDEQYYGTGSHYGGGFGTAPSSRASSSGTLGAPGYASQGAWTDPADWTPEEEQAGVISHRGRGPKGYMRTDERLLETICERLTDDPRIDASDIEIEVKQQAVTLRGTVDRRHTKYAVEELVEDAGARDIDNQLRVRSSG